MIEEILQKIGLNDREIKVYLATLELGESTVLPISKKSGIKRTYCYDILTELQKKNLVFYIEKNGRRRYLAENPAKIADQLKNRLEDLKTILPDLASIYNQAPNKPRIRYFEGKENIISLYESIIKKKPKSLVGMTSLKVIRESLGSYFVDYLKKIKATGVISRDLISRDSLPESVMTQLPGPKNEFRILPQNIQPQTDLMIFDNEVIFISYTNDIHAVVIESKAIAETQKALFEMIWQISKKI